MALPRIDAVARTTAVRPAGPSTPGPAALVARPGEDLLALEPGGPLLKLSGLAALAGELAPGDTLLMRVTHAGPRLELALVEALGPMRSAPSPSSPQADPPSMRFDQLAMHQLAAHQTPLPAAPALAAAWRNQVLQRWAPGPAAAHAATALEPAGSGPTALLPSPQHPPLQPLLQPPPGTERWVLPAAALAGMPVQLGLAETDDDAAEASGPPSGAALSLCVTVVLPRLGRITLRLRRQHGGIAMEVLLEHDEAAPVVRSALPRLALALAGAEVPLRSCRLLRAGAPAGAAPGAQWQAGTARIAAALPPGLFRAAAETVLALAAADAALAE